MFLFNDRATTEIYTLSLHDALPLSAHQSVATAAESDPAAVADLVREVVHGPVAGPLPVDGEPEIGEGVLVVGVAAALGDQDLRGEGAQDARDDGVEGAQPAGVVGAVGQREVHRAAQGLLGVAG